VPRCFEVEQRLRESLDIPVFHDDQHGTAIVALAALTNALKVVGKSMEEYVEADEGRHYALGDYPGPWLVNTMSSVLSGRTRSALLGIVQLAPPLDEPSHPKAGGSPQPGTGGLAPV
jgi:hypothetical protein